jgi:hypothetical protein
LAHPGREGLSAFSGGAVKRAWEFLAAWWHHSAADADLPVTPDGHVPVLQSDFTVKWVAMGASLSADIIESGDVVYEGGSPLYEEPA